MARKVVIYGRVSTDEQSERGFSLPSQLDAARRYAEHLGFEIVAEFREDISGAVPIVERPNGRQMAAMLRRREADTVVVYQVDRLSRDIVDVLATCREWLRAGIEVHACDIGRIESETDIVLVIRAWQGSDERKKIIERTSRGRRAKVRSGKVVASGRNPYGYRHADGSFEIDEPEADIVRKIFRWYTLGDETSKRPLSALAIAARLSQLGIATPGEIHGSPRKRKPGIWDVSTVMRMLRSETYAGTWRYGKSIGAGRQGGVRPDSETIPVRVPPLVSREMWEAAQAQRKLNARRSPRNNRRQKYLLRGLVKCGCGRFMSGFLKRPGHYYYRCSRVAHHIPGLEASCSEKSVRGEVIEDIAWNFLLKAMKENPEEFEAALREAQQTEAEALAPKLDELKALQSQLAGCEQAAAQVAQALAQRTKGIIAKKLDAQAERIERQYEALQRNKEKLEAELADADVLTDADIDETLQFRQDVLRGMQNPTFEDKVRIAARLRTSVSIKGGVATIACRIPIRPGVFDVRTSRTGR
jgi:site-specific DNA recombinase